MNRISATEHSSLSDIASRKRALVVPLVIVILGFFFPLPVLGNFTPALDGVVWSGLTWAWLFAFSQFAVALVVAYLYSRAANRLDDRIADELAQQTGDSE